MRIERLHQKYHLVLATLALALGACQVTYVVASLDGEANPPEAPPEGGAGDLNQHQSDPTRTIAGLQVACSEWGLGTPLASPALALSTLTTVLWSSDAQAMAESIDAYGRVLDAGTTGDTYCVALHMLKSSHAVRGLTAFYSAWLGMDRITPKDEATYGTQDLAIHVQAATLFAADVTLAGDQRFGTLFTSQRKILFAEGVPPLSPNSTQLRALAGGGLVSEAGVLAAFSGSEAWPSARGARVRTTLLCEQLQPKPDSNVLPIADISIPFREWHEKQMATPACQTCHKSIDPIGYALDVFDAVGHAHNLDRHGQRFELQGTLTLPAGETFAIASPADLGKVLATSIDAKACYLKTWLGFFRKAIQVDNALAVNPDSDAILKLAMEINAKNGFALPDAIATAARLAFEPQP